MADRKKASDFHPRILEIYDGYVHGRISKRDFMVQAAQFATAGVTGAALLEALRPDYALAQQVAPDDPEIRTETVAYDSPRGHGRISGLMARPSAAAGKLPTVLVVHENRGLNPYIADVVRRLGKAGYLALGPDGLSPLGGYPGDDDKGREMQASMDPARLMEDFFAAHEFLRDHPDGTGRSGAVGFCYGGGVCNALAVAYADLAASVPFYGRQPRDEEVARIRAPLLLHYAEHDERVNAGWPAYEAALKAHGKDYQVHFYPGTQHGFHNDSTPRYDPDAAELAWRRTLEFLSRHLS
ncbi:MULTISPECIES: YghX family hydrolase [unclassified Paracoccus (in: a-proteobacteria)]|uniref:YghX family hydrolase n=1 Tax=unclassified Paracoccus (in: a-proteobacteria) TaxID=2688777 RepID=UPI0012B25D8B|nr:MULTISPECIES: YghX family hydrolase [unclassified Paracoccus (in: a-proteobacteria)]UXU76052.1 dienelactone hydrolase family protein [Paracoccus sp. SMMA_5]UXU81964.1 dienelactone hydrolase family protein [Paracoccus sp. SMMA_5_TC]